MSDLEQHSLLITGRLCAQLFVKAASLGSLNPSQQIRIENCLDRFKLWAGNIGIFVTGAAAIDRRLEGDDETRELLSSILQRLHSRLTNLVQSNVDSQAEKTHPATEDSGDYHHGNVDSSDESSLEEEHIDNEPDQNKHEADMIEKIEEVLNALFRFLSLFKKPHSNHQESKVQSYKEKHTGEHDTESFESWIRWNIARDLTAASPIAVERLVKSCIQRHWKMLYNQSHYEKLKQNTENWFVPRDEGSIFGTSTSAVLQVPVPEKTLGVRPGLTLGKSALPTATDKAAPRSITEASSYYKVADLMASRSVETPGITASEIIRRAELDVPDAPIPTSGNTNEALCPYCCQVIGTDMLGRGSQERARWIRHVVKDCSPYICLFDDCLYANDQYSTINEWLEHMRWNHALSYCCKTPGHEKFVFNSADLLRQHLEDEHHTDFLQSEIEELVSSSSLPTADPFFGLINSKQPSTNPLSYSCPLCGDNLTASDESLTPSHHIAKHLESLGILCLSINDDLGSFPSSPSGLERASEAQAHSDIDRDFPNEPLDFSESGSASGQPLAHTDIEQRAESTESEPVHEGGIHTRVANQRIRVDSSHMVIGIDYGAKYTKVAFALMSARSADPLDEIRLFRDWGPEMSETAFLPSVISYELAEPGIEQWGTSISANTVTMVNTKVELDVLDNISELELVLNTLDDMRNLKSQYIEEAQPYHPAYGLLKSPSDVVKDFLDRVFRRFGGSISDERLNFLRIIPVDLVITTPLGWSYEGKNALFRAINASITFPTLRSVSMVAEVEAAALYSASYAAKRHILEPGDYFIVCDAGYNTVDVITYRATSTTELKQVGFPTGARCGSGSVDAAFMSWLEHGLGTAYYEILAGKHTNASILTSKRYENAALRRLTRDFGRLKARFSKDSEDFHIDLPTPLSHLNITGFIHDGGVTIPPETMRSFFTSSITQIIKLCDGQIRRAEHERRRVMNVFLVGGFAESPYVQEELRSFLKYRNISVLIPDTAAAATVQGAVLCGIEKPMCLVTPKASPAFYGIVSNETYAESHYHEFGRFPDSSTSHSTAHRPIFWFIRKGDLLLSEDQRIVQKELRYYFNERMPRRILLPIYKYDYGDAPTDFSNSRDELIQHSRITIDLSSISLQEFEKFRRGKSSYYLAVLSCDFILIRDQINVQVTFNGQIISRSATYLESIHKPILDESSFPDLPKEVHRTYDASVRTQPQDDSKLDPNPTTEVFRPKTTLGGLFRRKGVKKDLEKEQRLKEARTGEQSGKETAEGKSLGYEVSQSPRSNKKVTPKDVRDFRNLIVQRYTLDVEIWALRMVRTPDRPIVEGMMGESDAVLAQIMTVTESWAGNGTWKLEEYALVQQIRAKLQEWEKISRKWATDPLWGD